MPSQIVLDLDAALRGGSQNVLDQIFALISSSATTWNSVWEEWANWSNRYRNSWPVNFSRLAANPSGFHFYVEADFSKAVFSSGPNLSDAVFHESAFFRYADFQFQPNFRGVKFRKFANFYNASFLHVLVDFSGAEFMGEFSISVDDRERGKRPIPEISFENCEFHAEVNFSNRIFGGEADFQGAKFHCAPRFHNTSIHQGTNFGNVDKVFIGFENKNAEPNYRTLKLAMGQYQARTEEAAFAALELKSRRYRLMQEAKTRPFWKRIPLWAECLGYWLWEKFSKSGRGFLRPLALYLAFWGAFTASYVLPCQGWRGDWWAGIHYAFLKQFPFAAAFRGGTNHFSNLEQALFAAAPPPGWVTALNSAQSLIALTLIFLMGLGIRHKFRLR